MFKEVQLGDGFVDFRRSSNLIDRHVVINKMCMFNLDETVEYFTEQQRGERVKTFLLISQILHYI